MAFQIKKVAVLGSGVMGSQICAHLSNAGIPSLAFDLTLELAQKGIDAAMKLKPAAFYDVATEKLITRCSYDEHLELLRDADWVIEAIAERVDLKQSLFKKILPFLKATAIVSSNTSGISIREMTAGQPDNFKKRFLVTHFFNPPRYMRLLELVGGEPTDPAVMQSIADFCENTLGKGIVHAKDTPNFIANRIGVYGMMLTIRLTRDMRLTVEEVDKLTGPILGRPKSATYRTADVVGLDTLAHVVKTSYDKSTDADERKIFEVPDFLSRMIEKGWLGQKTKAGFYRKVGNDILTLDFDSLEYRPQKKVLFDGYRVAKGYGFLPDKIKALAYSEDRSGRFTWELLSQTLIYAARCIPDAADDIVNIDNALKWGFGWSLGPFEMWDAIGVERSVRKMEMEGKKVPAPVKAMLDSGIGSFYSGDHERKTYFDFKTLQSVPFPKKPNVIVVPSPRNASRVLAKNWCASIVDIGDGVACLQFHSVLQPDMNPIDGSIITMLYKALEIVPRRGFKGLVIGHQGANFSVGANLALILKLAEDKNWTMLEDVSKSFQDVCQRLKYAPFPVVSAPFNLCLGGGFEIAAAAHRIVASAELYCGAVEVGVGLIPGAGGTLRVLENFVHAMAPGRPGPFPPAQKAFETIGFGRVSMSAKEAVGLGYLRTDDEIVMNADQLIFRAKQSVLRLAEKYRVVEPLAVTLPGQYGRLVFENTIDGFVKAGTISSYDAHIGKKLAFVLTGGDRANPAVTVDEQYLLDLEREAFVSLAGEKLSQDRMAYMLKTGKPLRN